MDEQKPKKMLWIVCALAVILAIILGYFLFIYSGKNQIAQLVEGTPTTIEENLIIPDTKSVSTADALAINDAQEVPIAPQNNGERVIVPNATLTLKESYTKVLPEITAWSSDAKLVFVKSLGTVTLEGKSSEWQIVFGSKIKKKGYEIILQGDKEVSSKEVDSNFYGFSLPKNWYDAGDAIKSLQTLPQFANATISGINFSYNSDGKIWVYGLATSKGATAIPVR